MVITSSVLLIASEPYGLVRKKSKLTALASAVAPPAHRPPVAAAAITTNTRSSPAFAWLTSGRMAPSSPARHIATMDPARRRHHFGIVSTVVAWLRCTPGSPLAEPP